jgi:hypothetical protein
MLAQESVAILSSADVFLPLRNCLDFVNVLLNTNICFEVSSSTLQKKFI